MALSDLFDAWAPDDEDRIAGLGMSYEPVRSPRAPQWVRKVWRLEAEATPPEIWLIINDLTGPDSDGK